MKKITLPQLSDKHFTIITLGFFTILLCMLCSYIAPDQIKKTWQFVLNHLGYMAYILVPMTILLFSILINALFEPLVEGSVWARIIERLETFFPLVGLLSTFLAMALGLTGLTDDATTTAILTIVREICIALWGTIHGVAMMMVAHVVRKDLTRPAELSDAPLAVNPPEHALSQNTFSYDEAIPEERYSYISIEPNNLAA